MTRRRALALFGAAAGYPLIAPAARAAVAGDLYTWHGTALGAMAKITLAHPDRRAAEGIIGLCVGEIERLERVFSLHRSDSELSRLNRDGLVEAPSHDLVKLLAASRRFGALTEGAFDVTVQPLWNLYATHFARDPDSAGPDPAAIAAALDRVDYRAIEIEPGRVAFARPGMSVTLNGIAQGYITDRAADLLRDNGIGQVLLELGETRALDDHPEGRPWRIGLADPMAAGAIARTIDLVDRAVATSASYGTTFGSEGKHHHLFDPRNGLSAANHLSVSVIAARATTADALSTGLYVLNDEQAARAVRAIPDVTAILTAPDGGVRTLTG